MHLILKMGGELLFHTCWPFVCLFFFGGTGVWTQGFIFAKQAHYHLRHTSSHFGLVILEMELHKLFVWPDLKP
jgi:hypothetical protein